jgi:hypothetical protein
MRFILLNNCFKNTYGLKNKGLETPIAPPDLAKIFNLELQTRQI